MSRPEDCVPALREAGLDDLADWAQYNIPLRMGSRGRTCRDVWERIEWRPDWLLDYAQHGADSRLIVAGAAGCAQEIVRRHLGGHELEDVARNAADAAARWADGHESAHAQRKRAWAAAERLDSAARAYRSGRVLEGADRPVDAGYYMARAIEGVARAAGIAVERERAWTAINAVSSIDLSPSSDTSPAGMVCSDIIRSKIPFFDLASKTGV